MRPQIVFFNIPEDVIGIQGVQLIGPVSQQRAIIHLFNKREIPILLVHKAQIGGWRTEFAKDELIISFVGNIHDFDYGDICNCFMKTKLKGNP